MCASSHRLACKGDGTLVSTLVYDARDQWSEAMQDDGQSVVKGWWDGKDEISLEESLAMPRYNTVDTGGNRYRIEG